MCSLQYAGTRLESDSGLEVSVDMRVASPHTLVVSAVMPMQNMDYVIVNVNKELEI